MPLLGETRYRGYRVGCGGAERALVTARRRAAMCAASDDFKCDALYKRGA